MLIEELERLMDKIKVGMMGMGDIEFTYASKLYAAAREYRDAAIKVRDAKRGEQE